MRPAHRSSRPRHLAGHLPQDRKSAPLDADFDVIAALDDDEDFDFEALFAGDDVAETTPEAPARAARHKVAFAVAVTLAALPLLFLDNFQSGADPAPTKVEAQGEPLDLQAGATPDLPERIPTSELPPVSVDVTVAKATVFVADPTTTTTEADEDEVTTAKPTTTTTEKPAPTTTTTKAPATTTTVAAAVKPATGADPSDDANWEKLAQCESGGNWQAVSDVRSGQQYYGGLQFSRATWEGLGGTGLPSDAPKATQIEMGKKLQARQGWGAWPTCARRLGWI